MNRNYRVALLILTIVGLALALAFLGGIGGGPRPLAFCTAASGIITFFHFIAIPSGNTQESQNKDERLRAAIAGAVVVQYLVLVGLTAYFNNSTAKLPALTESMIGSFTAIVGVVVVFYFGSSAYIEVKRQGKQDNG